MSKENVPTDARVSAGFSARVFYHWKKPGAKERHGFAMGVVTAAGQTEASVAEALRISHPKLADFEIYIDKLEWK